MSLIYFLILTMLLSLILIYTFFIFNKKEKKENNSSSSFECGFSSYFFSRFSFSIHFYVLALTFLFLDLEICYLFPFFLGEFGSQFRFMMMTAFVVILLTGLVVEWMTGMLEWNN